MGERVPWFGYCRSSASGHATHLSTCTHCCWVYVKNWYGGKGFYDQVRKHQKWPSFWWFIEERGGREGGEDFHGWKGHPVMRGGVLGTWSYFCAKFWLSSDNGMWGPFHFLSPISRENLQIIWTNPPYLLVCHVWCPYLIYFFLWKQIKIIQTVLRLNTFHMKCFSRKKR